MAGDGEGILVGAGKVAVMPDMAGFATGLQAKVTSSLAALDTRVPVKFYVDPASVAKAQAALGPLAAGKAVPLKFNVDKASVAKARDALGPIAGKTVPIKFDADMSTALAEVAALQTRLKALGKTEVTPEVSLEAGDIAAELADLKRGLENLGRLEPALRIQNLGAFQSELGIIRDSLDELGAPQVTAGLQAAQAGEKAAGDAAAAAEPKITAVADAQNALGRTATTAADAEVAAAAKVVTATKAVGDEQAVTAAKTVAGTGTVIRAYGGWFGVLRSISRVHVPLFGGALTALKLPSFLGAASGLHLLTEAIIETTAVLVPASIALGAFGVAAAPSVVAITDRMHNLYTISQALNKQMPGMTGGFSKMAASVKPEVYSLFGDGLDVLNHKGSTLQTMAAGAGAALDQLGARVELAITSGSGTSKFAETASNDLAQLGDVVGNLAGTFGNLLAVMPGYAEDLLSVADAGTKVLESVTRVGEPIIGFGLKWHGALFYTGLAATAMIKLGTTVIPKVGLAAIGAGTKLGIFGDGAIRAAQKFGATGTQMAKVADNLGGVMGPKGFARVGTEAETAAGKTGILGNALGVLTKVPVWGWVALGVAALGGLTYWMLTTKTATQQWIASLQSGIDSQNTFTGVVAATAEAQRKLSTQLADTNKALAPSLAMQHSLAGLTGKAAEQQGIANENLLAKQHDLGAGTQQFTGELALEHSRLGQLTTTFGSTGRALGVFTALHIKANAIEKDSVAQWHQDVQAAKAYLDALTEMAGYQGGRALAAQNAFTLAQSDQAKAVAQVTQAEDAYITTLTGGEQAFTTWVQDLRQTAKDAAAGKPSVQGLAQAHASLASAQSRVASAQSSLSSLQKSGNASSTQLTAAQTRLSSANANLAAVQGKVNTATHTTAVSVGGLNNASLKLAGDFWSTLIPAGQKQIDALNAQFIGTGKLTTAVATIAKGLLPYAAHNTAARTAVVDLVNNALGPGTISLKNMNKWVGQNSTSMRGFKSIVDQSTVAASQLAKGLQNDLNAQFHQDLLAASGASQALKTYTSDLEHNQQNTAQGRADRQKLITDLENAGLSAKQAATYVDGLNRSLGKIPHHEPVTITMRGTGSYTIRKGTAIVPSGDVQGHKASVGAAAGTYVRSGTTATADDVVARVSKGELIVPAKMVSAGLVDHLRGNIPGFAAGGLVTQGNKAVLNGQYATNMVNTFTNDMTTSMVSAMKTALTAAATAAAAMSFPGAGPATGPLQTYAKKLLASYGWSNQWNAFDAVVNRESGWRVNAQNPSGAYGIPQALPGSKMAAAGADWATDGYTQLRWMMGYIKSVYGDPAGAWNSEVTRGWYDKGIDGPWLPPGLTLAANMTGKPEAIVREDQLVKLAHSSGDGSRTYIAQFPDEWSAAAMESRVRQAFTAMSINDGRRARIGRPG